MPVLYVVIGMVVVAVAAFAFKSGSNSTSEEGSDFSAALYMNRGSAAVGNTYRIPATVAEVNSHGEAVLLRYSRKMTNASAFLCPQVPR